MSLVQERLNISFLQTQGIYNTYAYNPENGDTSAACILADYFIQSRFIGQPGWIGGLIYCTLDDGFSILQIQADGTTAVVVGFGIVNTNTDFIPGKTVANYAALPAAASWPNTMAIALSPQGVILVNYKPSGIYYSNGATWTYLVDYVPVSYASEITNIPAGDITAFDVQGAIDQLDILKIGSNFSTVSITGTALTGQVNSHGMTLSVPKYVTAGGGGGGGVAISAGTNSTSTGTVVFSNANGLTFGMDTNAVVTASYTVPVVPAQTAYVFSNSNNVSFGTNASTVTASASFNQTVQPAIGLNTAQTNVTWTVNSSGISIDAGGYAGTGFTSTTTAGTQVKATQNTAGLSMAVPAFLTTSPAQTNQNLSLFALGNTTQNSSTVLNASALSFNGIGGITAGYSNGSIQLSGVTTRVEYNLLSAVGNTSGTNSFAASNFDNIVLSGGNNVTLSGTGNTLAISVGNYITTGRASNDGVGLNTAQTNVTWTVNSSGISINAGGYAGTGFTSTTTAGTAIVGTHNTAGLSIGVPTIITNALTTQTVQAAVGLNTAQTNVTWTVNSSGISINASGYAGIGTTGTNATMTLDSAGLKLNAGGYAGTGFTSTTTAGTAIVGTHNTAGLSIGVPVFITNAITTARASTDAVGLNTAQTNVTWTVNSSGISINAGAYLTTARASTDAIGLNTAQSNVTWTVNSSGLSLDARGYAGTTTAGTNASITINSGGINISVNPSTASTFKAGITNSGNTLGTSGFADQNLFLFATGGITLSQSLDAASHSASLTISGINNTTGSYYQYPDGAQYVGTTTLTLGNSSMYVQPFIINEPVSGSYIRHLVSLPAFGSSTQATTGNATITNDWYATFYANIFTQGVGASSKSIQLATAVTAGMTNRWMYTINAGSESVVWQITYPQAGANTANSGVSYSQTSANINWSTTGALTNFTGIRWLDLPFASSLGAGNYWIQFQRSTSSATTGGNMANSTGLTTNMTYFLITQASIAAGQFGGAIGSTDALQLGLGVYSTNSSGGTTNSMSLGGISTVANQPIIPFQIIRLA